MPPRRRQFRHPSRDFRTVRAASRAQPTRGTTPAILAPVHPPTRSQSQSRGTLAISPRFTCWPARMPSVGHVCAENWRTTTVGGSLSGKGTRRRPRTHRPKRRSPSIIGPCALPAPKRAGGRRSGVVGQRSRLASALSLILSMTRCRDSSGGTPSRPMRRRLADRPSTGAPRPWPHAFGIVAKAVTDRLWFKPATQHGGLMATDAHPRSRIGAP